MDYVIVLVGAKTKNLTIQKKCIKTYIYKQKYIGFFMKKAQFIHIEDYSKKGFGKTTGKYKTEVKQSTIKGVCNEANRVKTFCKHVPAPKQPILLFGVGLAEVEQLTEDYYNNTKTTLKNGKTRALRKDSDALLAGVVSVPQNFADWDKYKHDTINWLKNKYGHKLKCVVEHTDEPNPHIHFYVVQDPGLDFVLVHDGKKAVLESRETDKKKQMNIYKKAMCKFNDDFYTAVSSKYNLERKSQTARPRLAGTTEEYKQAIKQLEQLKEKNENLAKRVKKAKEQGFKAGMEEFKQKNIIAKFNVLNINKNEKLNSLEKELEYNKNRKKLYKNKYKKTKESFGYVKEQQQKDAKLLATYIKKMEKQKKELELKEQQKKELEQENEKLKNKNNYLNNMLNAVQKFFKNQWFSFTNEYYKEKKEEQKKTEAIELTPTPTRTPKLKI